MSRVSAFSSPIKIQAVAFLALTFILSIQRVVAASVTLSASLSRKIPFRYQGDTYQTWVSIHGGVGSTLNRPLVVVHGGPGLSHDYLLSIKDLAATRPVIFYDQIGSARSTHLKTKPESFFTMDLFLSELNNLLTTLGISDDYDLLGHSWGGVLGSELAVTKPHGLNKLILSGSLASMKLWSKSQAQRLAEFPEDVREGLKAGFDDLPKYRAAMGAFFAVHGCTLKPWPREMNASFEFLFEDPTVNIKASGVLAGWTIIDRLHNINVKTLVINGAADMAQDFVVQPFLDEIPDSTHVKFEHSSHTPFWEEREAYMQVVSQFLDS
ncbi:proline iminopeptidase [Thelephora ganbajun]|uniref:Proline iminopeptidase n=1 Tax=Thelephora ganbajun TaxID=370292 RepID=A0ACB6ZI57_THEGA|nr:proline iminopeptidase [Thelephora ganbajun]